MSSTSGSIAELATEEGGRLYLALQPHDWRGTNTVGTRTIAGNGTPPQQMIEEGLGRGGGYQPEVLAHRGQRRIDELRFLDVVEADQRQIFGHFEVRFLERRQQTERQPVRTRDHAVQGRPAASSRSPSSRPSLSRLPWLSNSSVGSTSSPASTWAAT